MCFGNQSYPCQPLACYTARVYAACYGERLPDGPGEVSKIFPYLHKGFLTNNSLLKPTQTNCADFRRSMRHFKEGKKEQDLEFYTHECLVGLYSQSKTLGFPNLDLYSCTYRIVHMGSPLSSLV